MDPLCSAAQYSSPPEYYLLFTLFCSQADTLASRLNRNIPLPCDLAMGFIIHTDLSDCWRLNSSAKMTYSSGSLYVTGKKLYLHCTMCLLLTLFKSTFSLQGLSAFLKVADQQVLPAYLEVVPKVVDLLLWQ